MNNYKKIKYLFDNGYYAVKRSGFVFSLRHGNKSKPSTPELILPRKARNGYLLVTLYSPKTGSITESLHRIVWYFFKGEIRNGLQINHKNFEKQDCRLSNLEILSHRENIDHALNGKRHKAQRGESNDMAKLTKKDVLEIRKTYVKRSSGKTGSKYLAKKFGVSKSLINLIILRNVWNHI